MSAALQQLAEALVASGVTVAYRYPCDQPAHAAGPCRTRHHLYDAGAVTDWTTGTDGHITLTISGRRERQIPLNSLRPTQTQTNTLTDLTRTTAT